MERSETSSVLVVTELVLSTPDHSFQFKHHDNEELVQVLTDVHRKCPNISRVYTLSERSVRGVPLYVIELSAHPGYHQLCESSGTGVITPDYIHLLMKRFGAELLPVFCSVRVADVCRPCVFPSSDTMKYEAPNDNSSILASHSLLHPEFKYIANMHGNEVLGRELLLKLADYLCDQYNARDEEVMRLVNLSRIHLLPSMNPDGWQIATDTGGQDYLIGRSNNHSVDLNRNFPDLDRIMFGNEESHIEHNNHLLEQWNQARHLALSYANLHKSMSSPDRKGCGYDGYNFGKQRGITNGAAWYSVQGGMQDFNYLSSNDFEITLELGCDKYPGQDVLEKEWEDNKEALVHYMWQVHIGVKGQVKDAETGKPLANAVIHVKNVTGGRDDDIQHDVTSGVKGQVKDAETGKPLANAVIHVKNVTGGRDDDIQHDVTSVHDGDYWRLLTPGKYVITAYRDDYRPKSVRVTVVNQPHQEAPRVDFDLTPVVSRFVEEGNPDYDQPYDDILQDKMVTDLRKKWAYHSLGPKRRY
uniref:Peptidase M14 domain-containing protein n=1 Tax=Timema cristinae TaxID=61476 RepID=A0A7R9CIC5_TIMCR|nr:unnamed protein product [Timema cristinae]